MKVIANEPLIKRNAKVGVYLNFAAIAVLIGSLALSYVRKELFWLSLVGLIVGFAMSQVSFHFLNRFSRVRRRMPMHEQVSSSLKGLSNDYRLYQYNTPADHLLVGPAGVWAILPYYQQGTVTYENGRWRQRGGGLGAAYMKIFAQEGLGRPDLDFERVTSRLEDFFRKKLDGEAPEVQAALVFVDKRAELQTDDAPVPTLRPGELKDLIRKTAKTRPTSQDEFLRIQALLPQPGAEK